DPVDAIDRDLADVRAQFPGLDAGITGGPALARTEATSTAHDIALASVLAIVSNVLLVVIPFAGIVEPGFALVALLIGIAWSFGFTSLERNYDQQYVTDNREDRCERDIV